MEIMRKSSKIFKVVRSIHIFQYDILSVNMYLYMHVFVNMVKERKIYVHVKGVKRWHKSLMFLFGFLQKVKS